MQISVIIPTRNREKSLLKAVRSVIYNNFHSYEIIVVDDNSTFSVTKLLKKKINDPHVKVIRNCVKQGPAFCRNLGIMKSCGKYIALIDDDCIVSKNWLNEINESHNRNKDPAIGGKTYSITNNTISNFWVFLTNYSIISNLKKYNNKNYCQIIPSYNCTYKREIFAKIGFFDAKHFKNSSGEDADFNLRINSFYSSGILYNPKIIVYHDFPSTFVTSLKKTFKYGIPVNFVKNRYSFSYLLSPNTFTNFLKFIFVMPFSLLKKITFFNRIEHILYLPILIFDEIVYRFSVIWGVFKFR